MSTETIVPPAIHLTRHTSTELHGPWRQAQILIAKGRAAECALVSLNRARNNHVSEHELAKTFHLIRGKNKPWEESLQAAKLTMIAHGGSDDALNYAEFVSFIEEVSMYSNTTASDFVERLIIDIAAMYDEQSIEEEVMIHLRKKPILTTRKRVTHDKAFSYHERARLYVLFQLIDVLFDGKHDGTISYKHVIEGMAPLCMNMNKEFRHLLLFPDLEEEDCDRDINFVDFKDLFDNLMGACSDDMSVDQVANIMTKHLIDDEVSVTSYDDELLQALNSTKFANKTPREDSEEDDPDSISPINLDFQDQRIICSLFNLWDTDNDDTLDINELFVGFRKFQKSKGLDETLQDVANAMKSVQDNDTYSNCIKLHEFGKMMFDLGTVLDVELTYLVEFLYFITIYEQNHEDDKESERVQRALLHRDSTEELLGPVSREESKQSFNFLRTFSSFGSSSLEEGASITDFVKDCIENLSQEKKTDGLGKKPFVVKKNCSSRNIFEFYIKNLAQEELIM